MTTTRLSVSLATLSLMLVAGVPPLLRQTGRPAPGASPAELLEIRRIQAHFDSVLAELSVRDQGILDLSQRVRRSRLLTTLRAYRDRGVFPHNYDFPERATPYFVDRKTGAFCAVGHLIASTGRQDIVDRVANANNNVRVSELAADTAFTAWLETNGLTLEEAARIQPAYDPDREIPKGPSEPLLNGMAVVAGTGAVAASLWNATANWDGHQGAGRALGIASGLLAGTLGVALLSTERPSHTAGPLMIGLGTVSLGLATHAIIHHNRVLQTQQAEHRKLTPRASLAPFVGANRRTGVLLSIAF